MDAVLSSNFIGNRSDAVNSLLLHFSFSHWAGLPASLRYCYFPTYMNGIEQLLLLPLNFRRLLPLCGRSPHPFQFGRVLECNAASAR